MPVYLVKSNPLAAAPRFGGVDAMLIAANSSAEAKLIAQATQDGDSDALWAAATATDVTTLANLAGWTFGISVNTTTPTVVSYTATNVDTIATIGTALATALLAAGHGTAHAANNTGTGVLTVASIADNIGDKIITPTVTPPAGIMPTGSTITTPYSANVSGGSAGAALTITLGSGWTLPGMVQGLKQ